MRVLLMEGRPRVTVIQFCSPSLTIDLPDSSDMLLFLYRPLTIQTDAGRHAVFQCLSSLLSRARSANDGDSFQRTPRAAPPPPILTSVLISRTIAHGLRCHRDLTSVFQSFLSFINTHLCLLPICLFVSPLFVYLPGRLLHPSPLSSRVFPPRPAHLLGGPSPVPPSLGRAENRQPCVL